MSERSLLGSKPVHGGALASARYEPEFDALQAEIAKLDSGGPNAVDWREVVRHGLAITETKSKDLLVGSYLAYGLLRTESFRGLADGLMILTGMIEAFWDDLHPPKRRETARVNAVNWLGERLGPMVEELPVTDANADAVIASADALGRLNEALRSRLENTRAELGDALRRLGVRAAEASALLKPPSIEPAPASSGPPPGATPAASSAPSATPVRPTPIQASPTAVSPPTLAAVSAPLLAAGATKAQVDRAIDQTSSGLRTLANAVRQADPTDPRAVELMRVAIWLPLNDLPLAPGGITPLRPPSAERVERSRERLNAGQFVELFHEVEESLDIFPYWFEGQRLADLALQGAGGKFARSIRALRGALATLLRRLPGLGDLRYADGTPFLDDPTRRWIDSDILAAPGGTRDDAPDSPWTKSLREAQDAVAQGRAKEGVALFSAARAGERAGRAGFLGDLALARLCLEAGFTRAALDIAGKLEVLAERRGLEDWEPAICSDLCALILDCYRVLPATAEGGRARADRIAAVQARLGWLAMDRALDFIDVV